jgi:3-hydroxyacyl-CoA dehydrogenase/enoyl-CoA hydratase/3-hydroxybutyryl-CoA epimerase
MNKIEHYKNWRLETDKDQILWLYFDKENTSVNTLNQEVVEELSAIIDSLANDTEHAGVVIASGKSTGFIAGADISQFAQFKDIEQATAVLRMGQGVFQKLASLKLRTVALIDGFCLGGGLELALACSYRIAEDGAKTRLGFPEVKLGIIPGWGGSVRMPRLIGALQALNLILSGHTVSGKAAARLGFVDVASPKRQLVHAAKYYILKQPPLHKATILQSLTNQKIARQMIGYYMRKTLSKKIGPMHYPAPFSALDN